MYPLRDSNSQNLDPKSNAYANSAKGAIVSLIGFKPIIFRFVVECFIQLSYRPIYQSTPGGIRTRSGQGLSLLCLPVSPQEHNADSTGIEPI
jgi:hypothetical protein